MKNFIQLTIAASLIAGSAASHHHQHGHFHKKHADNVEKRDVTHWVVGPTETQYVSPDGELIEAAEALKGLKEGVYEQVGETKPTYVPPPPPKPSSTSKDLGAQFLEKTSKTTSSSSTSTSTTSTSTSTSTSTTSSTSSTSTTTSTTSTTSSTSTTSILSTTSTTSSAPKKTSVAATSSVQETSSIESTGGGGLNSEFPDGEVSCSTFPSEYGATPLKWLNFGGWSGIQHVPDFSLSDLSISNIITGIAGSGCSSNSMCSYACPPGYQKSQWSSAQGSTAQSIGGLYCGSDNKLHLTRKDTPQLCTPGVGGIYAENTMSEGVSICRTDYPGTENMVIPAFVSAGGKVALTNPDSSTYYQWQDKPTTAQYYVNKAGYSIEDSCVWNSPIDPKGAGNWAPMNIGVGYTDGTTYISIFLNQPTSTADLGFNIEITGDVTSKCAYIDGSFTGGSSNGCTTGVSKGGTAVFSFSK